MASERPTVVVPLDGSTAAEAALAHAATIARRLGAHVLLLTVPWTDRPGDDEEARALLVQAIGSEVLRGLSVDSVVADEDRRHPQEAILAAAHERPASLVVMGTRGRGTVQRALLGSVAEAVVASLRRPVVLVGPACLPPAAPMPAGELVVATDGSRLSLAGVEQLAPWASLLGLVPTLVQVSEERGALWAADPVGLQILVDRAWPQQPDAAWEILHGDDPTAALVERARHGREGAHPLGCALLALTTHGATGPARVALGSVTADVAHRATVPVLAVHPDGVHGWWDRAER